MTSIYMEPLQKYLLMLLYARGSTSNTKEPITGGLWLHKEMFLISQNEGFDDEFDPYKYGPYSEMLDDILEQLEISNFVKKDEKIYLTDKGEEVASKIWDISTDEEKQLVIEVKEFLNGLNKEELLGYIYAAFPKMAMKSEIKDKIMENRQQIALSLFKKKLVSLEKAAHIADLSLNSFRVT